MVKDSTMGTGKSRPGDDVIALCDEAQNVIREVREPPVPIRNPTLDKGTDGSTAPGDTACCNVIVGGSGVAPVPDLLKEPADKRLILHDGHCPLLRPAIVSLGSAHSSLDDQDQPRRTGTVKVNVEPSPTWLSTQILPPCSSMNFRESARPSPVPSTFFSAVPTCRNSSKAAS